MKAMLRQVISLGVMIAAGLAPALSQPMAGFDSARSSGERSLEARFDAAVRGENMRTWMKDLSSHAHHVGSKHDAENAAYIAALFRSWGYDTHIEEFSVLFPTPKTRLLELTSPSTYRAVLAEPPVPGDTTSAQTEEQLPLYNCYSCDGDVSGELVYVNYGVPKDYEELDRRGIDVKGKIVIARYGGSWRGIKPKVAAEHGAVGCIIYSDPRDDGYFRGDVYPAGAYRNESGGQRGSVMDMPLYAGDPLTPFVGATKDAKRLPLGEVKTLTTIPVLPISYGDALPLLRAIGGRVAPEAWRGALPITYHCGPGPATVHLKLAFSWDMAPIRDIIATLKGSGEPGEWIIRGNHHDGWVYGAGDPLSGQVSMLEEARCVSLLAASGWRPKRTIVYCAWDGEEPGLLGSTEWVETHADELTKVAAVYVNSDGNGRGFFSAGGSHTLEKFVNQVARDVMDPEKHVSVAERLRAEEIVRAEQGERKTLRDRADMRIGALGSGSDYTPFLQHLGIASMNIGYGGEDGGGSYHSAYDSFDYYVRFGDPGFVYGVTQAETAGRIVLRLADADVLPLDFADFTETIGRYAGEVMKLADAMRDDTDELNLKLREKSFDLASDPTEVWVAPKAEDPVPYLDFSPLQNALAALRRSSTRFADAMKSRNPWGKPLPEETARSLDMVFMDFERTLTVKGGLPGRPWYVHSIYAPGRYTGYGVKTLPGIREAIETRKWREAGEQIGVVAGVLERASAVIDRGTSLLSR
ncbi:MAG TPA: transferrin receptor-like dimerization domain-containing protein [Bacteroidota bacterium]|nr:transferrin receptor-like dimerization domain-containing protein [Bacteroidota bacterium]